MLSLSIAVVAASLSQPSETGRSLGEPWFELIPGLWDLNPRSSQSWGVSGDGAVVYGQAYGPNQWESMTWTREEGVVARGGLVLRDSTTHGDRFAGDADGLYIDGVGWVSLGTPPGAESQMYAIGISADGQTVVGSARISGYEHPAIWTESEGARLMLLPPDIGPRGYAVRASFDGSVIAGVDTSYFGVTWVLRDGVVTRLPHSTQVLRDMTPDGLVLVGGAEYVRWFYRPPIGYQAIPTGPCDVAAATATDATGGYIAGGDNNNSCAFIYDRFNGTRDLQTVMESEFGLDLGPFLITGVSGMSDDGRVLTGFGKEGGIRQAWVAYLPLIRCPGDFNRDGELDFFDVLGFLGAFADADPAADLVPDGVFNFFDVATYLDQFSQDCL